MADGPSWLPEPDGDRTIERNWLFRLHAERHRSRASGQARDFFVLDLLDAVGVVATTTTGEVVLVRQFRVGSQTDSLEIPGGLIDAGEDPITAGRRELLEETGYAGGTVADLGTVWSNPSLLRSRYTTIAIAGVALAADPHLDHGEEVTIERYPVAEVPRLLAEGRVDHALTVLSLLAWLRQGAG